MKASIRFKLSIAHLPETQRTYRLKKRETFLKYRVKVNQKYRRNNLEVCKERERQYRINNREKRTAYMRKWRARNSKQKADFMLEYTKALNEKYPSQLRAGV